MVVVVPSLTVAPAMPSPVDESVMLPAREPVAGGGGIALRAKFSVVVPPDATMAEPLAEV